MSLQTPEKIRTLQKKLYRKAKEEPGYRFSLLYDKIYREDILAHAYERVKANQGAPGVDGQSIEGSEAPGLEPICEADLEPNAYGYRPKRGAKDAIQRVHQLLC